MTANLWQESFGRQIGKIPTSLRPDHSPTSRPDVQGAATSGDNGRLLVAAAEVCRTRKVTPAEIYVTHRSYPSPRSTFPTNLLGIGTDRIGRATTQFTIELERIHDAYGPLRKSLAILEFGHLWMNLDVSLRPHGLRAVMNEPVHWRSDVLGTVDLVAEARIGRPTAFPLDPSTYFDGRTSNPPSPEWYDERTDPAAVASLLEAVDVAAPEIDATSPLELIGHAFGGGSAVTLCRSGTNSTHASNWPPAMPRTAITVCVATNVTNMIGLDESTLLSAGRTAQAVALLGGVRGIAARPVRSIREALLSTVLRLPLDLVPIYQLRIAPIWRTALTRTITR